MLIWKSNRYCVLWMCDCSLSYLNAMRMRHIVICGLPGSKIIFRIMSYTVRFRGGGKKKKKYWTQNVFFFISSDTRLILRNERDMIKNVYRSSSTVKAKWSRYRPGVAQRMGRGIALLFHDRGTRRGWVVSSTPRPHFTPGKDPVTNSSFKVLDIIVRF